MADTPDTSPEAVERYEAARRVDRALNTPSSALKEIREWKARAEAAEAELMGAQGQIADAQSYLAERDALRKLDSDAATHVESVIVMRTGFTGDPPYVGWKGLGLALTEALDERDALRAELAEALGLLSHMVNHAEWREKNEGVFWEATNKARAFLARHQNEAGA